MNSDARSTGASFHWISTANDDVNYDISIKGRAISSLLCFALLSGLHCREIVRLSAIGDNSVFTKYFSILRKLQLRPFTILRSCSSRDDNSRNSLATIQ